MRVSIVAALFLLLAVAVSAKELKCWSCNDCLNSTPVEKKCGGSGLNLGALVGAKHVCMKTVSKDGKKVVKDCGRETTCKAKDVTDKAAKEAGVKNPMDSLYCCDSALCNSAPGAHVGVMGFVLAPALALIVV